MASPSRSKKKTKKKAVRRRSVPKPKPAPKKDDTVEIPQDILDELAVDNGGMRAWLGDLKKPRKALFLKLCEVYLKRRAKNKHATIGWKKFRTVLRKQFEKDGFHTEPGVQS